MATRIGMWIERVMIVIITHISTHMPDTLLVRFYMFTGLSNPNFRFIASR